MRAAMVGGGAYVAGKHSANRNAQEQSQEQRIAELEQQQAPQQAAPPAPAPAAPAAGSVDIAGQLTQLKALLDAGALTQAEFDGQKAKLLGGM